MPLKEMRELEREVEITVGNGCQTVRGMRERAEAFVKKKKEKKLK